MRRNTSFKNLKGYTLIEMLVAVAIVIIISMIAIPAVANLRKNLTLTKYDDMARQIYLISQNKLTTMKATGSLTAFLEEVKEGYGSRMLLSEPQDFTDTEKDWKKLYYFTDEDKVYIDYIMGEDSVFTASMENGGHFLVELNPETGDVYGVFYAETAFAYDEIKALASRDKRERKAKMLGYYGGISEFSAGEEVPKEFKPTAQIINKEDLYLKITSEGMRKLIQTQRDLMVTITVTGEKYNPANPTQNIYTKNLIGGTDFVLKNDKLEIVFLLDSIRGKNRSFPQKQAENFQDITQHRITPGSNIDIMVTITYAGDDLNITGNGFAGTTNSLFALKDDAGNLEVGYVRHLKNLELDTFKGRQTGTIQVADPVKIIQSKTIDFDYRNWDDDALIPGEEKSEAYSKNFKPINNQPLVRGMTFDGNNNELRNFKIADGNDLGLFAFLENSHMKNMKFVDIDVRGSEFIGALAGKMNGGSITDCGVYLTTRDKYGRPRDDMAEQVEKHQIQGTSHVGGMVGVIENNEVIIKNSFAAINVVGRGKYIGGFCGKYGRGTITDSYSSGKVTVNGTDGGGFIGRIEGTVINGCYTTSDVTYKSTNGNLYVGGFIGSGNNGSVSNAFSYGLVQGDDGSISKKFIGGFAGDAPHTSFNKCKYLRQPDYNYEYAENKYAGISGGTFPDLKAKEVNSPSNCHPYSDALVGNRMPFAMIKTAAGGVLPHYGDWPGEMKLQTSLVYYERYEKPDEENNYFGYYAETSLTVNGEDSAAEEANNWVLNTLRQEPCVEDGYALMTIYALDSFEYQLNGDLAKPMPKKQVTIADLERATPGQATKITEKVSLLFGKKDGESKYTISNAKVYRLPFDLQMTERNTAARFYDRLEISYQRKGGEAENYTFFYCPDFAKNAINPDINSTTIVETPKNPTGEKNPISVRSPRHLNALGRAAYYWNTTKWTDSKDSRYHFLQENDIDFDLYTKRYCGEAYDLMNTATDYKYKNRPIGRPNDQPFQDSNGVSYQPSNFRNSYNGQGYKIIDFNCVTAQKDDYQFTGLFGEVQQATLKNIVMIASKPEEESGRVISHYNDSKSNPKHPGVGALAGLVYVDKAGEYSDGTVATVSNCSVSGYVVKYEPTNNREYAAAARTPSAVGGLVGYNFGIIENSSAVNKLVTASAEAGAKNRFIGGLAGSINGRGSITNSYAGGTVTAEQGNTSKTTNLAGICAGFDDIYGAYYTSNQQGNRKMMIQNVYSFCEWKKNRVLGKVYAVVHVEDKISAKNGHYLTNSVENGVMLYDRDSTSGKNFATLSKLSFSNTGTAVRSGRASADNTHGYRAELQSVAYSYPAVVTNPREKELTYVHYGDWYYESTIKDSGYLAYYELYADESVGVKYVKSKKGLSTGGTYDTTNDKIIAKAGYGILRLSGDKGEFKINGETAQLDVPLKNNVLTNEDFYDLYSLKEESLNRLKSASGVKCNEIKFGYEETEGTFRSAAEQKIYINTAFADAMSLSALSATAEDPLKVRTTEQLQNLSEAGKGWYVKLDHNMIADDALGGITNKGFVFDGGYVQGGNEKTYNSYKTGSNGNYIFGLTKPLFSTIEAQGTVKNLALLGVNMGGSSENFAAVANKNYGSIRNCFATGTINVTVTSLGSAGLVLTNNGEITTSYVNMNIMNQNGEAAGFVLRNNGTIENCYALGRVTSTKGKASGFVGGGSAGSSLKKCYTIGSITGKSISHSFGFADSNYSGTLSACYWGKDRNLNEEIAGAKGTGTPLNKLKTIFKTEPWEKNNTGATWGTTMHGTYPYPQISGLDHYGDWPLARAGKVGAVRLIRQYSWNGWGYDYNYANGVAIDLGETMQTIKFSQIGGNVANHYGIVFDSAFAENLSHWTAECEFKSVYEQKLETIPLSNISAITLSNSNAKDFILNDFWVGNGDTLNKVTIKNISDSSDQYVFVYSKGTFIYQP